MWEAVDHRSITWIHVRSHGCETDPSKQHLLPLNERADRLAERGRSGAPCFVLKWWVSTIGEAGFVEELLSSVRAANIHETGCKCNLRGEVRSPLICRKCGMLCARHVGRVVGGWGEGFGRGVLYSRAMWGSNFKH